MLSYYLKIEFTTNLVYERTTSFCNDKNGKKKIIYSTANDCITLVLFAFYQGPSSSLIQR